MGNMGEFLTIAVPAVLILIAICCLLGIFFLDMGILLVIPLLLIVALIFVTNDTGPFWFLFTDKHPWS